MSQAADRNRRVEKLVKRVIAAAKKGAPAPPVPSEIGKDLDELFDTSSYGFREVVLTVICAWEAGVAFDPVDGNFYDCNPRSVYEQGIRPALIEHQIPCHKSGPLNVAKNINKLDEDWTVGKRPEGAAKAAVRVLRWMQKKPGKPARERATAVLRQIAQRLVAAAQELAHLAVEPREGLTLRETFHLLMHFITVAPDAGNTPQTIVHLLLKVLHSASAWLVSDVGKACETNLTAKKPADISIEDEQGSVLRLYEVTVKPIDINRIQDSVDSVVAHGKGHVEVTWLCRMPTDIGELDINPEGIYECQGVRCEFVDLAGWILVGLEMLGNAGRDELLAQLADYVKDPNVSKSAKQAWKAIMGD